MQYKNEQDIIPTLEILQISREERKASEQLQDRINVMKEVSVTIMIRHKISSQNA